MVVFFVEPGLYVMTGTPDDGNASAVDAGTGSDYGTRATQWFVVSDMGLTVLNGADGVHAFVRSLADAKGKNGIEVRLLARTMTCLAQPRATRMLCPIRCRLSAVRRPWPPALLVATDPSGDYGFLDLTKAPFDLSDRG